MHCFISFFLIRNDSIYLTFRKLAGICASQNKGDHRRNTLTSRVEYTGKKRPACSVMAISQFIISCHARHALKNNCIFSAKVASKRWLKRVNGREILHLWTPANSSWVLCCSCQIIRFAHLVDYNVKNLVEVALKSVSCAFKISSDTIVGGVNCQLVFCLEQVMQRQQHLVWKPRRLNPLTPNTHPQPVERVVFKKGRLTLSG